MLPEQSKILASTICGAFNQPTAVVDSFTWALQGFDFDPMSRAVKNAIFELDRVPSVKRLLGFYYAERSADRASEEVAGNVACELCRDEGGYKIHPDTPRRRPTYAQIPFIHGHRATLDDGKQGPVVWDAPSCCPVHAEEITRCRRRDELLKRDAERLAASTANGVDSPHV